MLILLIRLFCYLFKLFFFFCFYQFFFFTRILNLITMIAFYILGCFFISFLRLFVKELQIIPQDFILHITLSLTLLLGRIILFLRQRRLTLLFFVLYHSCMHQLRRVRHVHPCHHILQLFLLLFLLLLFLFLQSRLSLLFGLHSFELLQFGILLHLLNFAGLFLLVILFKFFDNLLCILLLLDLAIGLFLCV